MAEIEVHGSFKNLSPAPDIAFQFQPNGQPWASVSAAHNGTPEAYRAIGKLRFVDDGAGRIIEYWYKGGVTQAHLVQRYENLETQVDYIAALEGIKDETEELKNIAAEKAEYMEGVADNIYSQFENKNEIGTYNAAINAATIRNTEGADVTFTPDATPEQLSGVSFRIVEPGMQNITGTNIYFAVGGSIISRGDKWDYIPPADTGFALAKSLEDIINPLFNDDKLIVADSLGNVFFEVTPDGINWIGRDDELMEILSIIAKTQNFENMLPDRFVFSDADGNVFFEVGAFGINWIGRSEELTKIANLSNNYPDGISFSDVDGNEFFKADASGINYVGKAESDLVFSKLVDSNTPKPTYISDYFHILIYGQSLSVGGTFSTPIDFYDAKTFSGGILTSYDPDTSGAADTYFGSALIALPQAGTETQGKGVVRIIKDLLISENKIPFEEQEFIPVVSSAGSGGLSMAALMNPAGDYYRRLIESVKRAKDFAITEGKSYSVPVLCYVQGETDRADSLSTWYGKLETAFNTLNSDIKALTGQLEDVQFIVYQIASSMSSGTGVPLAFLKLAKDKTNVHFGCAMYQFTYADALHVNSDSTRIMGAMMGVVAKRAIVDKVKMQPIGINSYSIQKNEANTTWLLRLKMEVPVKPLVWDETVNSLFLTPPTHKGFEIRNGSNANIITSISIIHGDTINVLCSENPAGLNLTYAIGGRDSGGNLRDSQGNTITISTNGVTKRVDNWCPMFSQTI